VVGGRRRTDAPDGLWGSAPAEGMSDHPTGPGRNKGEPGRAPAGGADAPHRIPRSRLPLPPVPAAGGPRTSAAPFQAVPAPELPGGPLGDGHLSAPLDRAVRVPARTSGPLIPRPARVWPDDEPALVSTGPGLSASGARASGPAPRLPQPAAPVGVPSPAYGDWTKPSRNSEPLDLDLSADASGQIGRRVPAAPATSMIPERTVNRGRPAAEDEPFGSAEFDAPPSAEFDGPLSEEFPARGAMTGPGTGPVGGRAAQRAQRQAADMARRRAAKRSGEPVGVPDDEDSTERRPRRVLMGLVAMAVVALGVLGVYTVVSPETQEAASGSGRTQSSAPDAAPSSPVLPPLETGDLEIDVEPATPEAPAGPVLAPVTVLNATDINGLAAEVAGVLQGAGWETPGVGTYLADDITVPTVFYTPGDENQRLAAESLKAQFPQLQAVGERTFEVPADVTAPGLVVVLTGDWQP
jgi:LytR cell envelope-related transcriptional attenuator